MEPHATSSIPVRTSGIPRPTSRLPVLRPSTSQSQLRQPQHAQPNPAGQLRKKPSNASLSRPASGASPLQKKPSRTSLARPPLSVSSSTTATTTNTSSSRTSLSSSTRRVSSSIPARPTGNDGFKKPVGRPPSRQLRTRPSVSAMRDVNKNEDTLGALEGFRCASSASSRASSRAGFREDDSEFALDIDTDPVAPTPRKGGRPSLSDRTIESLSQLPQSPARGGRRRSSFFGQDNLMPPPSRPASAMGNNRRPTTSDGTPQAKAPATPRKFATVNPRGSMTAPGKRSVSAALPDSVSTPSKTSSVVRPTSTIKKPPLSQTPKSQSTPRPRPLSNSKTMTARTPKARPSLGGAFGQAVSPPGTALPFTPSANRENIPADRTPETARKLSSSSVALREQIAKAKAANRGGMASPAKEAPAKTSGSSGALREQIAKAKEAARRAQAARHRESPRSSPSREVPAVTHAEFGIEPDPAEIAEFDFGLDDPFNQRSKDNKSLLRKRVDAARTGGRLNLAAMALDEIPDEVLNMYEYDPNDNNVAWGETVDVTTIIAADNKLAKLPEKMFPDVGIDSAIDADEAGPQFGGVAYLDLHGNILMELPLGLRRLSELTKLNLARNQLTVDAFNVITQIATLRELKLAENSLEGALPASLGELNQLEVLELQGNKIESLPEEVSKLTHLRTLNIASNRLTRLPSLLFASVPIIELIASKNTFSGSFFVVDTVPQLQTLDLSNNSISSLCASGTICLPALKKLDVSINRLTGLPDISSWTSLHTLLVGENKLTSLPDGFVSLQQLRSADFTANDITKLDENIALMEGLENLTLAANPLRERKFLTMNAEDIKRDLFTRLDASTQQAAVGDEEVVEAGDQKHGPSDWELRSGGTLDLSFRNLSELNDDDVLAFAEGNDVRHLNLQQNYFTAIPRILSQLSTLTVLDLSKNGIIQPLSAEPLEMPKLRELRLCGNRMQMLEELTSMLSVPNLQTLDVSNNRIAGPLPALRETYPELRTLLASDNAISDVSAEALDGLKIVNLSNNEIPRLEPRIGLLAGTLTSLDVEGNTFRVPNYAVLQKGTDHVLTWLRGKIPSHSDNADESF